jgi:hypothetical protein
MVGVLPDLYEVDRRPLKTIEALRRESTRARFGLLRRHLR